MPFLTPFFVWEGSPTKIGYRKKKRYPHSNLSNLEDLVLIQFLDFRLGKANQEVSTEEVRQMASAMNLDVNLGSLGKTGTFMEW